MSLEVYTLEEKQKQEKMEMECRHEAKHQAEGLRGHGISRSAEVSKAEHQSEAADEGEIKRVTLANADGRSREGK